MSDDQLSMFPEPHQLARNTDPDTSKKSARQIIRDLPRLHHEVYTMVQAYPGRTCNELAELTRARDPRHIGRRLPELEERGLIYRGREITCKITGHKAATWHTKKTP